MSPSKQQIAAALRQRVLQLNPEQIGIDVAVYRAQVWGVIVETAYPDTVASLIALADGSVSLYVSDGNGAIGCGSNREIRASAMELLQLAESTFPRAAPCLDTDPPMPGFVKCSLLCAEGMRAMEMKLEDINSIDTGAAVLYFAAQRMISAIERIGAGQSLEQEMKMAIAALGRGAHSPDSESSTLQVKEEDAKFSSSAGVMQCLSVGNVVRRLRT